MDLTLLQVNYVASYTIYSISNEKDPFLSCLYSLDLARIVDLVIPSMVELEPVLPPTGPSEYFSICLTM